MNTAKHIQSIFDGPKRREIEYLVCPKCHRSVPVNGIGAINGGWMAISLSRAVRLIQRSSVRLFHQAGCNHDIKYHIYGYEKDQADREFLSDMINAVNERNGSWISKRWYRYQACKFYLAVKLGGRKSYESAQSECRLYQSRGA